MSKGHSRCCVRLSQDFIQEAARVADSRLGDGVGGGVGGVPLLCRRPNVPSVPAVAPKRAAAAAAAIMAARAFTPAVPVRGGHGRPHGAPRRQRRRRRQRRGLGRHHRPRGVGGGALGGASAGASERGRARVSCRGGCRHVRRCRRRRCRRRQCRRRRRPGVGGRVCGPRGPRRNWPPLGRRAGLGHPPPTAGDPVRRRRRRP